MRTVAVVICFLAVPLAAPAAEPSGSAPAADPLREAYRADAEKCAFSRASGQPLTLLKEPIMRWTNDDNWSGDVFAWTHRGRPEVIGCILSGPGAEKLRYVYHEFHLLAENPISAATVQDGRRWEPSAGLKIERLAGAPRPAERASARLAQMREIARGCHAYMYADATWELRLLTQPLMRYGDEQSDVIDGALFAYVWTKGTDPELILLLECRRFDQELAWGFSPARFSNRAVWLKRDDKDVWGVKEHQEPAGKLTAEIYTTAFARSMPDPRKSPAEGQPPP